MTDNDLIKRDDVIAILQKRIDACDKRAKEGKADLVTAVFAATLTAARDAILDLAAVNVRENVRGEWETLDDKLPEPDGKWVRCSVCQCSEHLEYNHEKLTWNFCPNCGADMRGLSDGQS